MTAENPVAQAPPERPLSRPQRLFGEIENASTDYITLGYGIPQQRGRSDSAPSIYLSNAMFTRPGQTDAIPPSQLGHQRSKSDMASIKEPLDLASLESFIPDPIRQDVHIRLRTRPVQAAYAGSLRQTHEGSHPHPVPPPSPPLPTFDSSTSNFGKSTEQHLNAIAKDSSPKKNPPALKSSRPRQQVSALTGSYTEPQATSGSLEQQIPGAYRSSFLDPSHGLPSQVEPPLMELQERRDRRQETIRANGGLSGPQLPNTTFQRYGRSRLTVETASSLQSRTPTPGSVTEFEENASDIEESTPLSATHPGFHVQSGARPQQPFVESPIEPSFDEHHRSLHAQPGITEARSRNLSIQTNTDSSNPPPPLVTGSGENTSQLESPELFEIVLGETMVLDQPMNDGYVDLIPPTQAISSSVQRSESQEFDLTRLSPNTPSQGDAMQRQRSIKVDESGYAAFHQIIQEYNGPSPISPDKVELLQEHVVEGNFEYKDTPSLEKALRAYAQSTSPQDPSPVTMENDPTETVTPEPENKQNKLSPPKLDSSKYFAAGEISPLTRSAPSSTMIGSEDGTASTVTQTQNRFSSQTATSDQPSLPEIQDTGGGLGLLSQEDNKATPLLQAASTDATSRSTGSSVGSQQYPASVYARSSDSQQASAGQREALDTPPTSSSRTMSMQSTEQSSRNASVDRGHFADDPLSLLSSDANLCKARKNIIQEFIDTEYAFHQDMLVMQDIYMATATSCQDLTHEEVRILFGNTPAVAEVSRVLADSLRRETKGVYVKARGGKKWTHPGHDIDRKSSVLSNGGSGEEKTPEQCDRETAVGKAFLANMRKIEKAFSEYVRNNDTANKLFQKIKQKEKVKMWLEECQDYAKDLTEAWDLDALIIKPTQRLLKYALLLNQLVRKSSLDHPDRAALVEAEQAITSVSHRINDSKRRHELVEEVFKARSHRDLGPMKLFNRRAEKLRQQVGLSEAIEDEEYRESAHQFNNGALRVQFVLRDYQNFEIKAEAFMTQLLKLAEGFERIIEVRPSTTPAIESKWRRWAMTIRELGAIGFQDHVSISFIDYIIQR